jgi:hypothetical protein
MADWSQPNLAQARILLIDLGKYLRERSLWPPESISPSSTPSLDSSFERVNFRGRGGQRGRGGSRRGGRVEGHFHQQRRNMMFLWTMMAFVLWWLWNLLMIKDTLRERRNLNLEGLPLNCPHCITGKMSALPYPKKGTENVSHDSNLLVGNIMVSDSFGPVVSRYGNKYVLCLKYLLLIAYLKSMGTSV